jgi:hypothetical protein
VRTKNSIRTGILVVPKNWNQIDPLWRCVPSKPVQIRDRLSTATKAQLTLTFRDGSELILPESSSYTIDQYAITATTRRQPSIGLWAGRPHAIVNLGAGGVPCSYRGDRVRSMDLEVQGCSGSISVVQRHSVDVRDASGSSCNSVSGRTSGST